MHGRASHTDLLSGKSMFIDMHGINSADESTLCLLYVISDVCMLTRLTHCNPVLCLKTRSQTCVGGISHLNLVNWTLDMKNQ